MGKEASYRNAEIVADKAKKNPQRISQLQLNLADLDKLPQITLNQNVAYGVWWPSSKVQLHDVKVTDSLMPILGWFWWAMPTLRIVWLHHTSYQKSNRNPIYFLGIFNIMIVFSKF
jgi:hypothetical protein